MRPRLTTFASFALASTLLCACNVLFGIEEGTPGTGGGATGASSSASSNASSASSSASSASSSASSSSASSSASSSSSSASSSSSSGGATCPNKGMATCDKNGVLDVCDATGHSLPPVQCPVVAACDSAAQACIDPATLARLAVGYEQVCAIGDPSGGRTVSCWGFNGGGSLVSTDARTVIGSATPVSGVTSVRQVALGAVQKCALEDDGSVWCWGGNDSDELGNSDPNVQAPSQVVGLPPAVEVRAGNGCTCARLTDGTVDCWGQGIGNVGCIGTSSPPLMGSPPAPAPWYPAPMPDLAGVLQIAASAGEIYCARISSPPGATVSCWTSGVDPSPIPMVTDALDVATGAGVVLILSKSQGLMVSTPASDGLHWQAAVQWIYPGVGSVTTIAAGNSYCGVQGGATVEAGQTVACTLLNGLPPSGSPTTISVPFTSGSVAEVAVGYGSPAEYNLAVACLRLAGSTISGNVYCWGDDAGGALGIGAPEYYTSAVDVPGITTAQAPSLWTSISSSTVVLSTGDIRLWGESRLRSNSLSKPTDDLSALFGTNNLTVRFNDDPSDGYVLKKGGPPVYYDGSTPATMGRLLTSGFADYVDMYAFGEWDIGLRVGGQVIVYGDQGSSTVDPNANGIFGDGSLTSTPGESQPVGPAGSPLLAKAIAAQGYGYGGDVYGHACAIDQSRAVWCWGSNGAGEVGNGDTSGNPVTMPAQVQNIADPVMSIAAGSAFSCAVTTTNKVYCWGDDGDNQLGYAGASVAVASQITTLGPATAVVAYDSHACALLVDQSVWCWGDNAAAQLGNGTLLPTATPTQVMGLKSDVVEISTSALHGCALHADGTVSCWGASEYGQVGTGLTEEFDAAQQVLGL